MTTAAVRTQTHTRARATQGSVGGNLMTTGLGGRKPHDRRPPGGHTATQTRARGHTDSDRPRGGNLMTLVAAGGNLMTAAR